jgi:hypothetical protein
MHTIPSRSHLEAPARALAAVVAAKGHIDGRELDRLAQLDAYRRLGVSRERFVELARESVDAVGAALCEQSWLRAEQRVYLDQLLEEVDTRQQRLLVCRLAAAVITADGCVTQDERLVYDHARARWHITQEMVTQAILQDQPT